MMPEVAEALESADLDPPARAGTDGSAPAAVEQASPSQVVSGASGSQRVSLQAAAYDVPVAALQVISLALRRYGAELLALTSMLVVCRYLLGLPALALGASVGAAASLARSLISRFRR